MDTNIGEIITQMITDNVTITTIMVHCLQGTHMVLMGPAIPTKYKKILDTRVKIIEKVITTIGIIPMENISTCKETGVGVMEILLTPKQPLMTPHKPTQVIMTIIPDKHNTLNLHRSTQP